MKKMIFKLILSLKFPIDCVLCISLFIPGLLMLFFRRFGPARLPISSIILKKIGVWPIRNHYYEPLFNNTNLKKSLRLPRDLPGIDMNEDNQLRFLETLNYGGEFENFVETERKSENLDSFNLNNDSFGTGDSDFLYQFIRASKPAKIIEIGSGNSTKIAQKALALNKLSNDKFSRHICIEPFEQPWLEKFPNIELIREKVETFDFCWENQLDPGDILFIDSSHMIRPQGDVLFEYLNIIPRLKSGVFVHVHDIFTPRDYLDEWVKNDVLFWNEQYLLEALLSNSKRYQVVASLNYLKHAHYSALSTVCPFLTNDREPGSFYFKVN